MRAPAGPGWRTALAAGLVLAVTLAAYLPSLQNGFTNWDDPYYVTGNTAIRSLSWHAVRNIFSSVILMYHPLTILSLAVDYRLFGLDPAGYHAVNLALHLANTLLCFGVIRVLSGTLAAAAAGALLFGVHPLHVESVAWISERKDVLSSFLFLGALSAYLRHLAGTRPRAWYLLALCLLAASLLAKPMGVTFPLVMYLCDYLRGRRLDRRAHAEKLPFFALALASSAVTLISTGFFGSGEATVSLSADNLFVATHNLVFYLVKAIVPLGLSALYPFPERTAAGMLPWRFLLSPVPAALLCLAVLRSARAGRLVPFGFLFYAVTLLPTLAMKIGPHFAADRYFYLPSLGLCYLAGLGFSRLLERGRGGWARFAAPAGLAVVAIALSLLTWQRTLVWRDSLSLWNDVIATHPQPGIAYLNRGLWRYENGDAEGAIADLTVFLAAQPSHAEAFRVRGGARMQSGRLEAALEDFDRAVSLQPDNAEALNNRGALLAGRGELARAVEDFTRAINAKPRYRTALVNRARAREALGDRDGAAQDFDRARALAP